MTHIVSGPRARAPASAAASPLNILFFLEPVIYRNAPAGLSAHFQWVQAFAAAAREAGGSFVLCANPAVCDSWRQAQGSSALADFPVEFEVIDPFGVLVADQFERVRYSRAAYGQGTETHPLVQQLAEVRARRKPTVVVLSAQNAMASAAFDGLNLLFIEQAPLPRLGHPFRTMIDPCGHQLGSTLERFADRIRALQPPDARRAELSQLYDAMVAAIPMGDPRADSARRELAGLKTDGVSVALLVTQPVDAVTFEGAGHPAEMENILYEWASALPPGWIGVPTYHLGQRLSTDMELALARSCERLRFLQPNHSQGLTEALLAGADGMVTVSSTAAMAGLLLGKRVAVTGRGPLSSWCVSSPSALAEARPLPRSEAESLLCFLTNRYCHTLRSWQEQPQRLVALIRQAGDGRRTRGEWLLDASDWTLGTARQLFSFRFCVAAGGMGNEDCFRPAYEAELATARSALELARTQEQAAREDRDRKDANLATTVAQLKSYQSEWAQAVADRDRLLRELEVARAAFALERQRWAEAQVRTEPSPDPTVLATLRQELQDQAAALGTAEAGRRVAIDELGQTRASAEVLRSEIKDLQRELGVRATELEATRLARDHATEQLGVERGFSQSLRAELMSMQRELGVVGAARHASESAREHALEQLAQEREGSAALRDELRKAHAREMALSGIERQLQDKLHELEQRNLGLQSELSERSGQLAQSQQRLGGLETEVREQASQLGESLASLADAHAQRGELAAALDTARKQLESTRRQAADELERHEREAASRRAEAAALVGELHTRLAEAESTVARCEGEVRRLESARALDAAPVEQLRAELRSQRLQGLGFTGAVIAERNEVGRLLMDALARVRATEGALAQARQAHAAMQSELESARRAWSDEVSTLHGERAAAQVELERVSAELELARELHRRSQATLSQRLLRKFKASATRG